MFENNFTIVCISQICLQHLCIPTLQNTQSFMTVQEIRRHLKYGDLRHIALMTGYSESLVKKVLHPNPTKRNIRKNDTIMVVATTIANRRKEERQILIKQFS